MRSRNLAVRLVEPERARRLLAFFRRHSGRICGFNDGGCWAFAYAVLLAARRRGLALQLRDVFDPAGRGVSHVVLQGDDGRLFDARGLLPISAWSRPHRPSLARQTVWMSTAARATARALADELAMDADLWRRPARRNELKEAANG